MKPLCLNTKWVPLAACLLMLCVVPAYAQAEDLEQMIMNDPVLKEKYGYMCTSINGIEFSSLPKPEISIQQLIDSTEDGDTRYIPSGHYINNTTYHIDKNLTLVGEGLVVADANRSCEVLHIEDPNLTVKIENIVFVNGLGEHGGAIDNAAEELTLNDCILSNNIAYNGSCIRNIGDELIIKDCRMVSNFAADYGGCIFDSESQIYAENVTFNDNYADKMGGVIYGNSSDTTLINCELHENNAKKVGAAICSNFGNVRLESSEISSNNGTAPVELKNATLVLKNCNISNNLGPYNNFYAGRGGGVWLKDCSALIENCAIRNNRAIYLKTNGDPSGFGGFAAGIIIEYSNVIMNDTIVEGNEAFGVSGIKVSGSSLVVNRGIISRNIARNTVWYDQICNGICGGISICNESRVTLNGVALEGNQADNFGGAIYNRGRLDLIDTTFISNNAITNGGAIYNEGTLNINGSTLSDNQAQQGGAIYNTGDGKLNLDGLSIFESNVAQDGGAIYNAEGGQVYLKGKPYFINNEALDLDNGDGTYQEGMGGAIFSAGPINIENGIFSDNKAISGSAIWCEDNMTDTNSLYYRNYAAATGTLLLRQPKGKPQITMTLNNPCVMRNIAGQYTGGICTEGKLVINGGKITQNTAGDTGGISCSIGPYSTASPELYINGATIADNIATGYGRLGGGISCDQGTLIRINTQKGCVVPTFIVNNTAGYGAGMCLIGRCVLDAYNTIIEYNRAGSAGGGIYYGNGSSIYLDPTSKVSNNSPDDIYSPKSGKNDTAQDVT
jgi:predicted outer membrane repeat protein